MTIEKLLGDLGLEIETKNCAEGGSAFVHKARVRRPSPQFPEEGTSLAIKEYKSTILSVPGQEERIQQEARLGREIVSDNVVHSYGLISTDTTRALILEWIDGPTLEQWISSRVRDPGWENLKGIALSIAGGLQALHAAGVLHRDIKPENIMLNSLGRTVLMDIGIAEITSDDEHTLHTRVGDFLGSVRTSSPQFLQGMTFTPKDDVYSLGATYKYLFSGEQLFSEVERKPMLAHAALTRTPEVSGFYPSVPDSMAILVAGALNKSPERRPSLDELIECIKQDGSGDYCNREAGRISADVRGYPVLRVDSGGAIFYAHIPGGEANLGSTFKVVRKDQPLDIPGRPITISPERLVSHAILKHIYDDVGFFVSAERNNSTRSQEYVEAYSSTSVAIGDFVLRHPVSSYDY